MFQYAAAHESPAFWMPEGDVQVCIGDDHGGFRGECGSERRGDERTCEAACCDAGNQCKEKSEFLHRTVIISQILPPRSAQGQNDIIFGVTRRIT